MKKRIKKEKAGVFERPSFRIKKEHGQHFLRDQSVVDHMIQAVSTNKNLSIFEIGVGDGFLTRSIIEQCQFERFWAFEIDSEWAGHVQKLIKDPRFVLHQQDFLTCDFAQFEPYKPWIILANLPYNISFPILHLFAKYNHLLQEGVIMVQEEVAQKLVSTGGSTFGYVALFFQRYFDLKLLDKIKPSAFVPPPKVTSRLVYLKPKKQIITISDEEGFWHFIRLCFKQPRRTLKNNLGQSHYDISCVSEESLALRPQQLTMTDFLDLWNKLKTANKDKI